MNDNHNILDEEFLEEENLIPYFTMHETGNVETFRTLFEEIESVRKWRYYYHYNDALRIIDLAYSKGVYDDYVVLIRPEDAKKVDAIVEAHSDLFQFFAPVEERFLRGLSQEQLIQALGSKHMEGIKLELATKILAESGITFTKEEIEAKKLAQIEKNKAQKRIPWIWIWFGVFIIMAMLVLVLFFTLN